jgi:hypothetical protein
MRAVAILGGTAHVVQPTEGEFEIRHEGDLVPGVLEVISRHPMRPEELRSALRQTMSRCGRSPTEGELDQAIATLVASGKTRRVERGGTVFWTAAESRFTERPGGPRRPGHDT